MLTQNERDSLQLIGNYKARVTADRAYGLKIDRAAERGREGNHIERPSKYYAPTLADQAASNPARCAFLRKMHSELALLCVKA